MFDKRNRWVLQVVMAIAALAFSGFLFLPLIGAFQNSSPTANPASPSATPNAQQAELDAQARGYELVLEREPTNQTALRGLVDIRIRQGDIQAAIAPLEKLAELNPDQPDYTVLLAQAKQRIGDREGAAQDYRDLLARKPGDLNALQGLVDLLLQQERPEAAVGLLQDTIRTADEANRVQPGSVDIASVQLLLGRVYAEQGRSEQAIAVYDQAIENSPQDFRPVLGKALVLQTDGDTDAAQPLFVSAASLAPAQYKDQINQLASGQSPTPTAPGSADVPASEASPAPTTTP